VLGQLALPNGYYISTLIPDVANGRIFILGDAGAQGLDLILICFDSTTFAMQSLADLGFNTTSGYPTDLILWGSNGIAFNTGGDAVRVLSGTFGVGSHPATSAPKAISSAHIL
jgi:hypothetical protein